MLGTFQLQLLRENLGLDAKRLSVDGVGREARQIGYSRNPGDIRSDDIEVFGRRELEELREGEQRQTGIVVGLSSGQGAVGERGALL